MKVYSDLKTIVPKIHNKLFFENIVLVIFVYVLCCEDDMSLWSFEQPSKL